MTRPVAWQMPLVFIGALVYLASGIRVGPGGGDRPPFDIDEAHKLAESYYYHLFFENAAWRHPDWQGDFYARTNPPLPKYIFGAVLAAAGLHVRDRRLQDDFDALWQMPSVLRTKVPDPMLRVTRGVSAAYGALTCALVCWIAQRLAGPLPGLLAAVLLLADPYFLETARCGFTDTILLFHLTLVVPASLSAARILRLRSGWGRLVASGVLVPGLVVALATGSKMNGALAGPLFATCLVLAAVVEPGTWGRGRLIARSLLAAGLTAAVALAVLVALNPTLHDHPLARLRETFVVFYDWMVRQQIDPGYPLFDLRERAAFVGVFTLGAFARARWGLPPWVGGHLMVIGFSLGLAALAMRLRRPARAPSRLPAERTSRGDVAVVLCWIAGVVAGMTLWMPIVRFRYAMPPTLPITLTAAIGLVVLARLGGRIIQVARRAAPSPGPSVSLAAATAVAAIALAVAWVADPGLLDPRANPHIDRADVQRLYLDSAVRRPGSLAAQEHAGILYLMQGRARQAADRLEAALELIRHDPPSEESRAVHRSILLFDLARARAGAGNLAGALDALLDHVAAVGQVRAGLRTGDPWVLRAFDQLIGERTAMATSLRARIEAQRTASTD